jgi:hypothetical protein
MAQPVVDLELRVTGGSGYRASSSTTRRLREEAFLPGQSPIGGYLRFELEGTGPNGMATTVTSGSR